MTEKLYFGISKRAVGDHAQYLVNSLGALRAPTDVGFLKIIFKTAPEIPARFRVPISPRFGTVASQTNWHPARISSRFVLLRQASFLQDKFARHANAQFGLTRE